MAVAVRQRLPDALEAEGLWTRDEAELRRRLEARDVNVSQDHAWAKSIDHALSAFLEPILVQSTILRDYPIELSPFARTTDDDPTLVEHFATKQSERQAGDVLTEEGDPDFVKALSYGMPPNGGLGLGIDRPVMVLSGRETIRDVALFPALRERI
jgi:lysyl-tRNA synthetase, class II